MISEVSVWEDESSPSRSAVFLCLLVCVGFSVRYFGAVGQSEAYATHPQNKPSRFQRGCSTSPAVFSLLLALLAACLFTFLNILQDREVRGKCSVNNRELFGVF